MNRELFTGRTVKPVEPGSGERAMDANQKFIEKTRREIDEEVKKGNYAEAVRLKNKITRAGDDQSLILDEPMEKSWRK